MQNKLEIIKELINDGGSAQFGFIKARVKQEMVLTDKATNQKNPLWAEKDNVEKLVEYKVLLNSNYSNRVNKALLKEGKENDFVAKENWHEKVYDGFNGSIVRNRNNPENFYLLIDCIDADTLEYYVNGKKATKEQIQTIKQFRKVSSAKNQGLENEIIVRTIKFDNIIKIHANKIKIEFTK
jgi:hypothetical protein